MLLPPVLQRRKSRLSDYSSLSKIMQLLQDKTPFTLQSLLRKGPGIFLFFCSSDPDRGKTEERLQVRLEGCMREARPWDGLPSNYCAGILPWRHRRVLVPGAVGDRALRKAQRGSGHGSRSWQYYFLQEGT